MAAAKQFMHEDAAVRVALSTPDSDLATVTASAKKIVARTNRAAARDGRTHVVCDLVTADNYGRGQDDASFFVTVRAKYPVSSELITPGRFVGHVAASWISLAKIRAHLGTVRAELAWACPFFTKDTAKEFAGCHVLDATAQSFVPHAEPAPTDLTPWTAGLDPSGFVGLYAATDPATPDAGLLVVCARATPASLCLAEALRTQANPPLTYADVVTTKTYQRIVDLGDRNVRRLLYRAASALGSPVPAVADMMAVPNSVAHGTAVPGTRDAIMYDTTERPLLAMPDFLSTLDIFTSYTVTDTSGAEELFVNYYNALVPSVVSHFTAGSAVLDFVGADHSAVAVVPLHVARPFTPAEEQARSTGTWVAPKFEPLPQFLDTHIDAPVAAHKAPMLEAMAVVSGPGLAK